MSSLFSGFDVKYETAAGVVSALALASVEARLAADDSLVTTLAADEHGHVASGALNVNPGTEVVMRAGRNGYTGQIVLVTATANPVGEAAVLVREAATPRQYVGNANVARVALYSQALDENGDPDGEPRLEGYYGLEADIYVPNNRAQDRNVTFYALALTASGTAGAASIQDAPSVTAIVQSETASPAVVQIGASESALINLQITGFTRKAVARRVRWADDAAMSQNLLTDVRNYGLDLVPNVHALTRPAVAGQAAATVYVRVSHSSVGPSGPWSPESPPLAVTFSDAGGTGGSTGDGNFWYGDSSTI